MNEHFTPERTDAIRIAKGVPPPDVQEGRSDHGHEFLPSDMEPPRPAPAALEMLPVRQSRLGRRKKADG